MTAAADTAHRLAEARRARDAALVEGRDARRHHDAVARLETEESAAAEAARANAASAAAAVERQRQGRVADRAARHVEAARWRLAAAVPTATVGDLDPAVTRAAAAVAAAELAAEDEATAVRHAEGRREALRGRVRELEKERRGIGARRAGGDLRPDDGPELALLAADVEALGAILEREDAAALQAKVRADAAVRILDAERAVLDRVEAAEMAKLLQLSASASAEALTSALNVLDAMHPRLRRLAIWEPPAALLAAVTRARFLAGI